MPGPPAPNGHIHDDLRVDDCQDEVFRLVPETTTRHVDSLQNRQIWRDQNAMPPPFLTVARF
jgi:hypothetical protein